MPWFARGCEIARLVLFVVHAQNKSERLLFMIDRTDRKTMPKINSGCTAREPEEPTGLVRRELSYGR
jgi:hypothetical protein